MTHRRLVVAVVLAVLPVVALFVYLGWSGARTDEFTVSYDSNSFDPTAHENGSSVCAALPGHAETVTLTSLPPADNVTVRGNGDARAAVRRCYAALPGARVADR